MTYIHNTLEINNIKYRYINININSLKLYLLKHDLMKSFEFIIKEHKENYDFNELFKDHRKNRKLTKFFILYKNKKIFHVLRYVFKPNGKSAYVDFIHTLAENRNKGIGSICLSLFIDNTKNIFKIYELKVRKSNNIALKLYQKKNFKIVEEIKQKSDENYIDILVLKLLI
jgi:ribosomal protein S18 acetylase RimI-like enzyme